jgi:hypothetical protein
MAPHAENNTIGGSSPYPARSSSYRVWSVIDAYGGDPGIQFSPTEKQIPTKETKGVWNAVRKLRTDEPLSYQEIDETYGSDMDVMAAMVDEEYDPYRPVSPVPVPLKQSKKEREQLVQRIYDSQISQKQIDDFVKVRVAAKEKALPPMPKENEDGQDDGQNRKRTDSALSAGALNSLRGKTYLLIFVGQLHGTLSNFCYYELEPHHSQHASSAIWDAQHHSRDFLVGRLALEMVEVSQKRVNSMSYLQP